MCEEARSLDTSATCQCYDQMRASVGRSEQKEWRSDATNDASTLREDVNPVKLSAVRSALSAGSAVRSALPAVSAVRSALPARTADSVPAVAAGALDSVSAC